MTIPVIIVLELVACGDPGIYLGYCIKSVIENNKVVFTCTLSFPGGCGDGKGLICL